MTNKTEEQIEEYNKIRTASFASSLVHSLGAVECERFGSADMSLESAMPDADRALIVHPLTMGQNAVVAHSDIFCDRFSSEYSQIDLASPQKANTNAALSTMYTGLLPDVHKVKKPNNVLVEYTAFDELARIGKKSLVIAPKYTKLDLMLKGRDVTVLLTNHDVESVNNAMAYIKACEYALVVVILGDFDETVKIGGPFSKSAYGSCERSLNRFSILVNAAEAFWRDGRTLVGFCPDRGCHKVLFGATGGIEPADVNVRHFYSLLTPSEILSDQPIEGK